MALVVICAVFAVVAPTFASWRNAQAIVEQASIPLVIAMGTTLVVLIGSIDLSVEGVIAASGLTFVLLARNTHNGNDLGLWAVVAGVGVGALFGLVNGAINAVAKVPSFMVTLGTWFVGLGVATVLFGDVAPQLRDPSLRAWGGGEWLGIPVVTCFAIVALVVTVVICRSTRLGRAAYAIGGDEAISRMSGLPVRRYRIILFTLAGVFSGVAGVLATIRLGVGNVSVGSGSLFLSLSAVVVGGTTLSGGRGGPLQSLVGVLLLVVLGNGLLLSGAGPYVQQAAQGIIIVVAVVLTGWPLRHRLRVVK